MAPVERTEIVENLERSRQEFIAALAGLSESQAKLRPDPERWSVLDCVEHVATVEERFLGWLEAAEKLDAPRVDKEKEVGLTARVPDRSTRVKAPDAVLPVGRFTSLAQAVEQFNAARTRCIQFADYRSDDLYCARRSGSAAARLPWVWPCPGSSRDTSARRHDARMARR